MSEDVPPPAGLEDFGWSDFFARAMPEGAAQRPARVASVYGTRVDVWTETGPRLAAVRRGANRESPVEGGIAVGDWVAVGPTEEGGDQVVVEHILPRRTVFLRQAAGERSEPQAIAANIDRVFVVTSLEGDLNPRRLERYLVAIRAGGAEAIVLLGKADLCTDPAPAIAEVALLGAKETLLVSAKTGVGIDDLRARMPRGTTSALVGSSGVGKSALLNVLLGRVANIEGAVRQHDKRGRHTTTRRVLFQVPGGGLVVDTPGMRELKPWQPGGGAEEEDEDAFDDIAELANVCRYRDCVHEAEPGCAVHAAAAEGRLTPARLASWQKLERERAARGARQEVFAAVEQKRRAKAYTAEQRRKNRG
jgi:ribosome biogenesis GTPase / thiamine phosphate phosphatase